MIKIILIVAVVIIVLLAYWLISIYSGANKCVTKISFNSAFQKTGMPIITVMHEGLELNFIVDSGSNVSCIDKGVLRKLKKSKVTDNESMNITFGKGSETVDKTVYFPFTYKGHTLYNEFIVANLAPSFKAIYDECGVRVHGLLGCQFLDAYSTTIDFKAREIYTLNYDNN